MPLGCRPNLGRKLLASKTLSQALFLGLCRIGLFCQTFLGNQSFDIKAVQVCFCSVSLNRPIKNFELFAYMLILKSNLYLCLDRKNLVSDVCFHRNPSVRSIQQHHHLENFIRASLLVFFGNAFRHIDETYDVRRT